MRESRQFVRVNDKTTELVDLQFGVPQGSILRPVLINSTHTILTISMTAPFEN